MEMFSIFCFMMAAFTYGLLMGHYITKDQYFLQSETRKENE